jgi:hypothetical protein
LPFSSEVFSSCLLPINVEIKVYETIVLPLVVYGCDTWCVMLREKNRLKVFENRRIFGSLEEIAQ